jgi:8-oxo-dGTP pyrophosphatase MutT (NUDIX family)
VSMVERQLTASALVLTPRRELVVLRHRKLGVWLYPGGHVEKHETPDEAVGREVEEETGLEVRLIGPRDEEVADENAGVFALHKPYTVLCERIDEPAFPHDHLDFVYACVTTGRRLSQGSEEMRMIGAGDVAALETFPTFRALLNKVFADGSLWRAADAAFRSEMAL